MALESATNIKAAAALAAVQLSVIWTDTVVAHTALEIRNGKHPLRQIEKMFLFNPATGAVTADDAYIDAVVTGGKAPSKGNEFDVVTNWLPLTLVSATVEDLAPTDIVLTFNRAVANYKNVTISGDVSPAKTIVSTTIVTVVVTIVVNTAYIFGDVITVSGDFRTADNAILKLTDNAVVNNVLA